MRVRGPGEAYSSNIGVYGCTRVQTEQRDGGRRWHKERRRAQRMGSIHFLKCNARRKKDGLNFREIGFTGSFAETTE